MGNQIFVTGNIVREPELKYTPQGKARLSLTINIAPARKNETGQWEDNGEPIWVGIRLWENDAETIGDYLHKGTRINACGMLRSYAYTTQSGEQRIGLELINASVVPTRQPKQPQPQQPPQPPQAHSSNGDEWATATSDDVWATGGSQSDMFSQPPAF